MDKGITQIAEGSEYFRECTPLQQRWLLAYCSCQDQSEASTKAKVQPMEAMAWYRDDGTFQNAVEDARRIIGMDLEAKALKKAKSEEGSDRLMIELLKAFIPERYDSKFQHVDEEDEFNGSFTTQIEVDDAREA